MIVYQYRGHMQDVSIDYDAEYDDIENPAHYVGDGGIGPTEYAMSHDMGFAEGNVVKYVTRWKYKDGLRDLRKARRYLDMLIEHAEEVGR